MSSTNETQPPGSYAHSRKKMSIRKAAKILVVVKNEKVAVYTERGAENYAVLNLDAIANNQSRANETVIQNPETLVVVKDGKVHVYTDYGQVDFCVFDVDALDKNPALSLLPPRRFNGLCAQAGIHMELILEWLWDCHV